MGCIIQISPHLEVSYNTSAGQQIAVLGGQHYTLLYIYTSIHLYIYTSIHLYTFIHLCLGRSAAPLLPVPGQIAVTGRAALLAVADQAAPVARLVAVLLVQAGYRALSALSLITLVIRCFFDVSFSVISLSQL